MPTASNTTVSENSESSDATKPVTKILVANRGEIAVRIIRAARDEGLKSIAVYAEGDREALHARLADEAYALGGSSAAETYLSQKKLLNIARTSNADSVHPGYGFLAENPEFAEAVINTGLTWIGPPPTAIKKLGNKVEARRIAGQAGAPLAPGTAGIVSSVSEVIDFANAFGFPIAIKAAHGGGGRGIKIVRKAENIEEMYESAVREATAAFGSGECFVERFLDKPRHVETQCIADAYGNVSVISTRDCSLQRRNQKLVEEAPAPFLTAEQNQRLYEASKALLRTAGYEGVGTCEFLIGSDGMLSFLEVNTRLQVEHPVSEEVTGLDLVREQFRIARGEKLGYGDPEIRGHSFEFRINGEDPGHNFLPHPGTVNVLNFPSGPGIRIDSGIAAGDTIDGNFDSMLAKLIVTGKTRKEALERSRRALAELTVEGIATVVPFHQAVVSDPAFAPEFSAQDSSGPQNFNVYTTWIEKEFNNVLEPYANLTATLNGTADAEERRTITVEVAGKRVEVSLPAKLTPPEGDRKTKKKKGRSSYQPELSGSDDNSVINPMPGTIVKVSVSNGDKVAEGDLIVVLEAMKMEQPITAHKSGVIADLSAEIGQTVSGSSVIATIV